MRLQWWPVADTVSFRIPAPATMMTMLRGYHHATRGHREWRTLAWPPTLTPPPTLTLNPRPDRYPVCKLP